MPRSKAATSTLAECAQCSFRPVLPDATVDPVQVERVLLCTGKVPPRPRRPPPRHSGPTDTDIVRLERLCPFAEAELAAELAHFPAAANVRWVQEEPESKGAWSLVTPRLHRSAGRPVACVSRPEAPAPRSAPPSGTPWSREPSGHRSPGEQRRFQQGSAAPEYPPTARQHRGEAAS
ncbi:hypothetical protein ACFC8N_48565 [Streptomyces sp. NPDC055966]|uniref:hypothetical protein n=1 Tax=Streptomyces sp. NPDC055966 TaxID=3345669 RepID=UPI0035D91A4B